MKRIGIDCRFAGTLSGHGRYLRELIPLFLKNAPDVTFVLFVLSEKEDWIDALPATAQYELVKAPYKPYGVFEQIGFPKRIEKAEVDILLCPHFNVPLRCPVPFIVVIHDLILHRYPNQASFLKRFIYKKVIQSAVDRAKVIVSVSTFTAQEISHTFGRTAAQKTTVILNGVSSHFHPQSESAQMSALQKYNIKKPFLLYVGNAKEHKNVPLLLKAWKAAHLRNAFLVLVVSGKESKKLQDTSTVRIVRNVDDADLPSLYSAAAAFVSASVYEGFGLPIAEAQACGCPIIACKKTAIPEVAAPGSLLVEPTVPAFADAFLSIRNDRTPYIVGTWEDTANHLLGLLRKNTV